MLKNNSFTGPLIIGTFEKRALNTKLFYEHNVSNEDAIVVLIL